METHNFHEKLKSLNVLLTLFNLIKLMLYAPTQTEWTTQKKNTNAQYIDPVI